MLPGFWNDPDQLQADSDRGKTGSILSVINDTIGTRRDANLDISGVQKSGESSDQKSDGGICTLFFGIYGNRQADIRGALGDGYSCFCIIICGAVYAVSISGYVYGLK